MIHAPFKSGISPHILFVLIYSIHIIGWVYLRFRQHWIARSLISMASVSYVLHHFMRVYDIFNDSAYFQSATSLVLGVACFMVMVFVRRVAFYACVFTGVYIIVPDWHSVWLVLVVIGALGVALALIAVAGHVSDALEFVFITTSTSAMMVMGTATLLQTGKASEDALDTSRERVWEYLVIVIMILIRMALVFVIEQRCHGEVTTEMLRDRCDDEYAQIEMM